MVSAHSITGVERIKMMRTFNALHPPIACLKYKRVHLDKAYCNVYVKFILGQARIHKRHHKLCYHINDANKTQEMTARADAVIGLLSL